MNYRFQPVSRLTLVFILAVIVSGGILTWFSINNISNLKELTEKRILEEERELAVRYSVALQNHIESVTNGFQEQINPPEIFIDSLIKTKANYDFIQQTFLMKEDGTFLYPCFSDIPETSPPISSTDRFSSIFNNGEMAEFRENNLNTALQNYRSAMKYGKSGSDSASVLVALARVSMKSGDVEKGVQYYIELISKYDDLSDSNGIPYVNFALQQFVQLEDTTLANQVLNTCRNCLEKMKSGKVPLTYQTKEILARFSGWIDTCSLSNDTINARIEELISGINRQIDFVYFRRNELFGFMKRDAANKKETAANRFFVMNSTPSEPTELLLLNSDSGAAWGFQMNGNILFETVLEQDFRNDFKFGYSITFPSVYNNSRQQYLTTTALLRPYFNQQWVQIKLADENALQKIIRKRSWIYGVASTLLLVAMLLGIYLILRDITREKRLAQLRSDFISNVTHELKTPLTSIYMFTESLLLRRIKNSKMSDEYLSVILKESERLKRMINNILEFSKAEKGVPEYHFVKSNVADVIRSALKEMDYWFEKENFKVATDLDKKIELTVDPEKMKQAFVNLISNAIKYSNSEKKLDIRLYKNDSTIHIEFEDKGIGIPEEQQSRIFEKFYRSNPKEGTSGTGLGLTVVKEIVEAHKGKINVDSQVGKGSKFSIILKQKKTKP